MALDRPARVLLFCGPLSGLGSLCVDMYLPCLPDISRDLHASTSATQASLTTCLVGLALGQVLIGPVSDRVSRRPPLFFGLAAFAVDKAADNVIAPYSVAVDSVGNVYVGEVTYTYGIKLGRVPEDHAPYQVQKFTAPQAAPRGEAVR
jgi:MFS family permease